MTSVRGGGVGESSLVSCSAGKATRTENVKAECKVRAITLQTVDKMRNRIVLVRDFPCQSAFRLDRFRVALRANYLAILLD